MNDFVSQLKTKQSIVAASEWLPPQAVVHTYARQTFLTSLILATDNQGLIPMTYTLSNPINTFLATHICPRVTPDLCLPMRRQHYK